MYVYKHIYISAQKQVQAGQATLDAVDGLYEVAHARFIILLRGPGVRAVLHLRMLLQQTLHEPIVFLLHASGGLFALAHLLPGCERVVGGAQSPVQQVKVAAGVCVRGYLTCGVGRLHTVRQVAKRHFRGAGVFYGERTDG